MAENGVFRSAFRGFNKQDVLNYIEEMTAASAEERRQSERRAAEAEESVRSLTEENDRLQAKLDEAQSVSKTDLQALTEQNEKLTALAQAYKREMMQLREQLAATEMRVADAAMLQERVTLLEKQNEQYARLVGDVSRVVTQARVVSASYFDNAHKNSIECLAQLQSFLDELKEQTAQAVKAADLQHEESGDTIDTLLEQLQGVEPMSAE